MELKYIVKDITKYKNIKQIFKEEFLMSDRLIVKLKNTNQIYLNNKPTFVYQTISKNDIVTVSLGFEETCENIIPTSIPLNILYEDDCMLIVNKPPFMPVHPSMNHFTDSLSNGIKYYYDSIGLKRKIRPVNRLDKNTSGIVIFAKNEYVQECLVKQMKLGIFEKEYFALVNGILDKNFQIINTPIARKENSIIERCVSQKGETAMTEVTLIKKYDTFSSVKCILKTGRTHQIRVHMQYIGHSILGDDLYGEKSELISRQSLHAYKVNFIHPISKEKIQVIAELPNDIQKLII